MSFEIKCDRDGMVRIKLDVRVAYDDIEMSDFLEHVISLEESDVT